LRGRRGRRRKRGFEGCRLMWIVGFFLFFILVLIECMIAIN
jgi:hypothetical protein